MPYNLRCFTNFKGTETAMPRRRTTPAQSAAARANLAKARAARRRGQPAGKRENLIRQAMKGSSRSTPISSGEAMNRLKRGTVKAWRGPGAIMGARRDFSKLVRLGRVKQGSGWNSSGFWTNGRKPKKITTGRRA